MHCKTRKQCLDLSLEFMWFLAPKVIALRVTVVLGRKPIDCLGHHVTIWIHISTEIRSNFYHTYKIQSDPGWAHKQLPNLHQAHQKVHFAPLKLKFWKKKICGSNPIHEGRKICFLICFHVFVLQIQGFRQFIVAHVTLRLSWWEKAFRESNFEEKGNIQLNICC